MTNQMQFVNKITYEIIGCCYRIHTEFGPGLLESVYELCLEGELYQMGYTVERQVSVPINYKDVPIRSGFRADLIVENAIILEVKAVESFAPVHQAQLLTYMRLANKPIGLLLNFNVVSMKDGIKRFIR